MKRIVFPVLGDNDRKLMLTIPWEVIAPCEHWAQQNHSQSLDRLAERGGLCLLEMVAVLEGRRWRDVRHLTILEAHARVQQAIARYWEKKAQ